MGFLSEEIQPVKKRQKDNWSDVEQLNKTMQMFEEVLYEASGELNPVGIETKVTTNWAVSPGMVRVVNHGNLKFEDIPDSAKAAVAVIGEFRVDGETQVFQAEVALKNLLGDVIFKASYSIPESPMQDIILEKLPLKDVTRDRAEQLVKQFIAPVLKQL